MQLASKENYLASLWCHTCYTMRVGLKTSDVKLKSAIFFTKGGTLENILTCMPIPQEIELWEYSFCMFVPHNEWNFGIIHLHPTSDRTLPIFMMFVPHTEWNFGIIHLQVCTPQVIALCQYSFACLCHTTSGTLALFICRLHTTGVELWLACNIFIFMFGS